jgi:hypothetical protein
VTDLTGRNEIAAPRKRRASDRAGERAERAADAGDTAAQRIAGAQLDALLRARAAYRRAETSAPPRRFVVGGDL